jgi:cobalt transporter subunit CbtB
METRMTSRTLSPSFSPVAARAEALRAAFVALTLGLGLVYVVGFSPIELAHGAAHDTRHAVATPCH